MNNRLHILLLVVVVVVMTSCRKDGPQDEIKPIIVGGGKGVYITNEGNFQFGNAKVSYYNKENGDVTDDLFEPANHVPLGDVCQSMYLHNNKYYIVLNNSNKIVIVNPVTFVEEGVITGLSSPRYFLPVSNSKAYVTDYNANAISIVDLSTNTKTGSIPCGGWTEELTLAYGKAYITNQRSNKVYVINTATDVMEDSITVSYGGNSIQQDSNGKLWVMCNGNDTINVKAALYRINPVTNRVEQAFQFSNPLERPWRLDMNGTNDTLYYLNTNAYRMAVTDATLPVTPFVAAGSRNLYAIGVDPYTSEVYIADAIDYIQRGVVYRYIANGTVKSNFKAGLIPGDFYFN